MRITQNMTYSTAQQQVATRKAEMAVSQRQVSSGNRIERRSDDPVGSDTLAHLDSEKSRVEGYQNNILAIRERLTVSENALTDVAEVMRQASERAIAGASDTNSAADRTVMAQEIRGLREELLALANTRSGGSYLFAGSASDTLPFDTAGVYQGDDFDIEVEIRRGQRLDANITGDEVFVVGAGIDLFAELDGLATDLEANDGTAVRGRLAALESGHEQAVAARAGLGGRLRTLDEVEESNEGSLESIEVARGIIAGAPREEAELSLLFAEQSLEATFLSVRKILETFRSGLGVVQ